MVASKFDVSTFNVEEFDRILSKGLSHGLGKPGSQVCIEAAICQAMGLPHGDDPGCVTQSLRKFKITLNDSRYWSSPQTRAQGLHDLGLAQLGSKGVIKNLEFNERIAKKTIRILIPKLFREVFANAPDCLMVAIDCEVKGTAATARAAASVARKSASAAQLAHYNAAYAAGAADYAADAADYAADYAAYAADAADYAAYAASSEHYLILSAKLALEVLRELGSPGIRLLTNTGI